MPLAGHLTQSGKHAHDADNPLGRPTEIVGSVSRAAPQQDAAQSPPKQREAPGIAGVWIAGGDAGSHVIAWGDQYSNLLIMLFTGVLTWVGWEQWRLLRRSTEESAAAIEIARRTAEATSSVASGTVMTGAATAALANVTESALKHARDVAESDLRPWVTFSVLVQSIRVTKTTVRINGTITATNIGRTVAAAKIGEGCLAFDRDVVPARDATIERVRSFAATSVVHIIPQQEREVPLLCIEVGRDGQETGGLVFLTVAAAYGNGGSRDYLTSETFMITMRNDLSSAIREGFGPEDFSGGAADIHIDLMTDMSVIR